MKAMILAAGRGERMRPLTDQMPKPLLKVGEYSLIEYLIRSLAAHGFHDLVINHAWLGQQIEDLLADGSQYGVTIQYSAEGETGLETGGGIFKALSLLDDDPFLVVNGDIWTDYPFSHLRKLPVAAAHLVLVANPQHNPDGDFALAEDGFIANTGQQCHTFSGIGVYQPEIFSQCHGGKFALTPLLRKLADAHQVTGEVFDGVWSDVGTVERLQVLNSAQN